jgi:hypothetical protein
MATRSTDWEADEGDAHPETPANEGRHTWRRRANAAITSVPVSGIRMGNGCSGKNHEPRLD